ncbi:hypothetical protein D8674_038664 [Pyrus ussuriensis x Pyrus communis]|uniref:Uncharacterized protein n=1 Tax=Pyrus ussuriensis x Pyrus communis TaxID=2448454 RepID=A0A5N5HVD0_9ROSA|nr:hypothetical protein D8674_038664 [Pyrus ussuriensis x Pyrus communis]
MSLTAGIRPVCSIVYQMTNIFGYVPNCFHYWKCLALFLQHRMINYGMFCADSLLYLSDYQAIQSSMEFRNGGEISSNSFGVLLNNNWPLLINLEVFNGFATSYFPYYFWASNLFPEHDAEAFEYDEETWILLDHSPEMLFAMKWVLLVHTLFLAIFNSIYLPHELVVGDATRLIVLVLPDFILAGSEILIFVFWVNTPKMFWKNMVRDLKPIQKLILNMSMVHRLRN